MSEAFTLHPIGHIRTGIKGVGNPQKFHALHQPDERDASQRNVIELLPDPRYRVALSDLEGFSRIWVLWRFHKTHGWRPKVLPPRGPNQRRGVFATRSPNRPNPIAMTPVQLIGIDAHRLIIGPCDALDGTPVFDIKPYLPTYDAFPDAKAGWFDAHEAALQAPPQFTVEFSSEAAAQADWLAAEWAVDFRPRLRELLARDPSPHRTRRIKRLSNGESRIECGAWRVRFRVDATLVTVLALEPGYSEARLFDPGFDEIPDREAQCALLRRI